MPATASGGGEERGREGTVEERAPPLAEQRAAVGVNTKNRALVNHYYDIKSKE